MVYFDSMSKLIPFALGCSTALVAAMGTMLHAAEPADSAKGSANATAPVKKTLPNMPLSGLPKTWLQGTPVTEWEKDKVYIFEFWATWCGPCIKAMPHMEALHQQVKDKPGFQIIGVNVMDHHQTTDDLKKFLAKRDPKLNYTIAADLDGKSTHENWLKPQKVNGIPVVFAIKNGQLIWRGHPTVLTEQMLLAMAKPDFDSEAFKKFAPNPRRDRERFYEESDKLGKMMKEQGLKPCIAYIRKLEADGAVKGNYLVDLYLGLYDALGQSNNKPEADKLLGQLHKSFPTNYRMQYSLAERMVKAKHSDTALMEKCLDLALKAAGKNPFMLSPVWVLKSSVAERQGNIPVALQALENAIATTNLGEMTTTLLKASGDKESLTDMVNRVAAGIKPESARKSLPIENMVKDERFSPMFEKLTWLNHPGIKGLPKDKTVFLGIWRVYMDGGPAQALDLVLKKYGLLDHPEVRSLVLSIYPVEKEKLEKMGSKMSATPYPVGMTTDKSLLQFAVDMKLDSFPATVVVRNGEVIWAGEIRRVPTWVIEEVKGGLPGTYAERKLAREAQQKKAKEHMKRLGQLRKEKKADEYYRLLDEGMKDYGQYAWYSSMVAEAKAGKFFVEKDYANAVKVLDDMVARFPLDENTASYAMKIYTCNEAMQEHSYEARRRALQVMRNANTRGSDDYNSACYEEMQKLSMERRDYVQAKKDAEKALADMALMKKYAALKRK